MIGVNRLKLFNSNYLSEDFYCILYFDTWIKIHKRKIHYDHHSISRTIPTIPAIIQQQASMIIDNSNTIYKCRDPDSLLYLNTIEENKFNNFCIDFKDKSREELEDLMTLLSHVSYHTYKTNPDFKIYETFPQ